MTDLALMQRALRLADRGRGRTPPNPMVGAIVVDDDGVIVGDGYHERAGLPHAEVRALDAAGERARGATLYCTLEPCCHTGRTGPCAERIVAAGIRHVVAATLDPNPRVNGAGVERLRASGIQVTLGVAEREAVRQNAVFFTRTRMNRPFVIAKAAISLDGYIAAAPGVRSDLSGPSSRRHVQRTRAEVDAIGVGVATLLCDDPLLTARDVFRRRPLTRVIFDRQLRTPSRARIFGTTDAGPIVIMTAAKAVEERREQVRALTDAGARIEVAGEGRLGPTLTRLGELGISSLLLEGGAAMHGAAWEAGMIDRVQLYVAPVSLGGGVPLFGGQPFSVGDLHDRRTVPLGDDVFIEGDVQRIG